ncbi:hypothetical protein [Sphingomonas sp. BK069]|uniref:hypothetical protein n=1 Tax=Sphingomonas sp. BK069 TaxID=2586979 RepID=UPI00161CAD2E|nr:hypothetical protein [Sphingomonas sp. BK069]MBB3348327.1 hypothetical protein [Sphingomonas sp. BK069]
MTFVVVLTAGCVAAAFGAMQVLEDVAMSAVAGGVLFVFLASLSRLPHTQGACRPTRRAGRLRR